MAIIQLSQVSHFHGNTPVLVELALSFAEKQVTALIGPSGSGKSTLLQLLNGLTRPTSGQVRVLGQEIDYGRIAELRLRLGYAVQGSALFPHLTAAKNITLLAELAQWSRARIHARLQELMRLVNLPEALAARYPHELSGGEQQRVGLCRAMMLDPPILLLDEPFGALDPITRNDIHTEFLRVQQLTPRTIVLVTHDLREALKLAQHLVILRQGRVEQSGSCAEVLQNPATEFVRTFLQTQLA